MTIGVFPCRNAVVIFCGCWCVSPLQGPPPNSHLRDVLQGLNESLLQDWYLDGPEKLLGGA